MDMTSDRPDWEALARHLANESDPGEAEELRRWLAEDPARAGLVGALDRRLQGLAFRPQPDLDIEAALRNVTARMDEPLVLPLAVRDRSRPSRRWAAIGLRAAAALVLVAGASIVWRATQRSEPTALAGRDHATLVGERDSVRLPDGSLVLLGPESRLTVSPVYGARGRELVLSGEALFDVVHDAAQPFRVRAGAAAIEDLGTTFTVRADTAEVRIVVTTGAVMVQDSSGRRRPGVILRAGDRARVGRDGTVTLERGGATEDDVAWIRGQLVFRDAPLTQVRADLRRWYGVDLRVDTALGARHVTASFSGESVDQVLRTIGLALGARVERRGNVAFMGSK